MELTRRNLLGGFGAASALHLLGSSASAQDASPVPESQDIGYGIARVLELPSLLANTAGAWAAAALFLPQIRSLDGHRGYVEAMSETDPLTFSLALVDNETTGAKVLETEIGYVEQVSDRIKAMVKGEFAGAARVCQFADALPADSLPFLYGSAFSMREKQNRPEADLEAAIALIEGDLVPTLVAMHGFIAYVWILTDTGRVAINIWQTAAQVETGNAVIADWSSANTADITVGETVTNVGKVAFAELPGLT